MLLRSPTALVFLTFAPNAFVFVGLMAPEVLRSANQSRYQANISDCPLLYYEPCESKHINFVLLNKNSATLLDPFGVVLPGDFNKSIPVKIMIHGYGGLAVDRSTGNVTLAYEEAGYNVVFVDWSELARIPCYLTAFVNTLYVGKCVAIFTLNLVPLGIHPGDLHLIGFSLGAHIASFASNHLQRSLNVSVGRITGLDPALPLFATNSLDSKLDAGDADFVDVIHTSSGSFGKLEPVGHVDFYLNGGYVQPACLNFTFPLICSHNVAGAYYSESVAGNARFTGVKCSNFLFYTLGFCTNEETVEMGERVDRRARGVFYVTTADKPPYALG